MSTESDKFDDAMSIDMHLEGLTKSIDDAILKCNDSRKLRNFAYRCADILVSQCANPPEIMLRAIVVVRDFCNGATSYKGVAQWHRMLDDLATDSVHRSVELKAQWEETHPQSDAIWEGIVAEDDQVLAYSALCAALKPDARDAAHRGAYELLFCPLFRETTGTDKVQDLIRELSD